MDDLLHDTLDLLQNISIYVLLLLVVFKGQQRRRIAAPEDGVSKHEFEEAINHDIFGLEAIRQAKM